MRTRLLALIAILLILTPGLAGCVPVPEAQPVGQPAAEAPSRRIDTQIPVEIPREQVFVIDQIFRYSVVNNFNLFVSGPPTPTRQGLALTRSCNSNSRRVSGSTRSPPRPPTIAIALPR